MLEQELWKEIPGWEGFYSASTFGQIKSLERTIHEARKDGWKPKYYVIKEKILKPFEDNIGRLRVSLSVKSKIKYRFVHSLVLLAFKGVRPLGYECCHVDGNPGNNHLSNLYYGTRAENIADAKRHGTFPIGSQRPGAILTANEALQIYNLCKEGLSDKYIANKFNVTKSCIVQIRLGNNWKEVTGGIKILLR